jgi:cold shock protein
LRAPTSALDFAPFSVHRPTYFQRSQVLPSIAARFQVQTHTACVDGLPRRKHVAVKVSQRAKDATAMPQGRVKWFDNRKGFGFIIGERGEDVFIHYSAIVTEGFRTLNDGELVRYEVIQGPKGLLARGVQRITEERTASSAVAASGEALRKAERFFESGGASPM